MATQAYLLHARAPREPRASRGSMISLVVRRSPAAIDPFLEARGLGTDGRIKAMTGQYISFGWQREQSTVDRLDDLSKTRLFVGRRVSRAARKQRVASKKHGMMFEQERDRPWRMAGIVNCVES